jgi:hypothetical protein
MLQRILFTLATFAVASSFNISPFPSIVFKKPDNNDSNATSLFGYSLNLRKQSVMIGAPKAMSDLTKQWELDQPGVVYKCSLGDESSCKSFTFDDKGNEQLYYGWTKLKDSQLLGWSMDGFESDDDNFMSCAPSRAILSDKEKVFPKGVCYKSTSTKDWNPIRKTEYFTDLYYSDTTSQCGFSVHAIDRNNFIVGCPGTNSWKGTIGIARPYQQLYLMNLNDFNHDFNAYLGFAVSSVKLSPGITSFISSAPRIGKVFIFDNFSTLQYQFSGQQTGEYFGYTLMVEDFNGDSYMDLAIAAPYYSIDGEYDHGGVYIFLNDENVGEMLSSLDFN